MSGKGTRIRAVSLSHDCGNFLQSDNPEYRSFVNKLIRLLFLEDMGSNGDITGALLTHGKEDVAAYIRSNLNGKVSGIDEVRMFLEDSSGLLSAPVRMDIKKGNGSMVRKGEAMVSFEGRASDLLALERTMLNVIGRMSGVANYAMTMVGACGGKALVVPTRKTLWGSMDKRACHDGGAGTHRLNLSDAILIKDNHLKIEDGGSAILAKALMNADIKGGDAKFIEVEVTDKCQLDEITRLYSECVGKSDANLYILLDNMSPSEIKDALKRIKKHRLYGRIFVEASGGISLQNAAAYARTGVDIISSGAMTHSAPWFDISMEFELL